jgi:hypothetical protein
MAVKSLKRSSVKSTQKTNAMNAGYNFQDFELIESVFLSSTTASVTFNNLNQYATEYKHLQIRAVPVVTQGLTVMARLNGDTGSNYSWHTLVGNGSSVTSGASSSQPRMVVGIATDNTIGAFVIDFLDAYSSNKNKTMRSLNGTHRDADRYVFLSSGLWLNTSAINSITFFGEAGGNLYNFVSGSRFSLYGIR